MYNRSQDLQDTPTGKDDRMMEPETESNAQTSQSPKGIKSISKKSVTQGNLPQANNVDQ